MSGKKFKPLVHLDPRLKSRIKELIFQQNKYPDEVILVEELQKKFPEYKRKKANLLKIQIRQCLEEISNEDSEPEFNNLSNNVFMDVSSNKIGFFVDNKPNTIMNDSIIDLYQKSHKPVDTSIELEIKHESSFMSDKKSFDSDMVDPMEELQLKSFKKQKQTKKSLNKEGSVNNEAQDQINKLLEKQLRAKNKYVVEPVKCFDDFGGIDEQISEIKKIFNHFQSSFSLYDEDYKGLLLHGPPGVGKSSLVEAIAKYLNISLLKTTLTSIDNSDKTLNELFELAKSMQPCIIFLDKIDFLASKSDASVVDKDKAFLTLLNKCFEALPNFSLCKILVIAATNKIEKLDPIITNIFERKLKLDLPNENARLEILNILKTNAKISEKIDLKILAQRTPGYVAKDYKTLLITAKHFAINRLMEESNIDAIEISDDDIEKSLKIVQPISKNEGFAAIPNVSWQDIGALKEARDLLKLRILDRVRCPKLVKSLNLNDPVGILMYGPPGCGKTLLAKAIANEADINFISVRGPELLNKYVGESERAVRELFTRANSLKPCLIFFDEFDAISKSKSDSENHVTTNIVKQLLTEMDGFNSRSCFMLAATNRPDLIDPAILRPGRFGKGIYIGFPNAEERVDILKAITKNGTCPKCADNVNFEQIATSLQLEGCSGADLKEFVTVASEVAFKEYIECIEQKLQNNDVDEVYVDRKHFEIALNQMQPSLSEKERKMFENMKKKFENRSKE